MHPTQADTNPNNSQTSSILKTVSWRISATIITGLVVFLYTGELAKSSEITLTAAIILTLAYYLHERFWIRIRMR